MRKPSNKGKETKGTTKKRKFVIRLFGQEIEIVLEKQRTKKRKSDSIWTGNCPSKEEEL